jgi:hypothetical protein
MQHKQVSPASSDLQAMISYCKLQTLMTVSMHVPLQGRFKTLQKVLCLVDCYVANLRKCTQNLSSLHSLWSLRIIQFDGNQASGSIYAFDQVMIKLKVSMSAYRTCQSWISLQYHGQANGWPCYNLHPDELCKALPVSPSIMWVIWRWSCMVRYMRFRGSGCQ